MAKNYTPWFRHDTDASQDEKIDYLESIFGLAGYAFYFKMLEFLTRSENYELEMTELKKRIYARKIRVPFSEFEKMIEEAVSIEAFVLKNDKFYSRGLKKRMTELEEVREKRSKIAKLRPRTKDGKFISQSSVPKIRATSVDKTNHTVDHTVDDFATKRKEKKREEKKREYNPKIKNFFTETAEGQQEIFIETIVKNEWADKAYAEKTWNQAKNLQKEVREKFFKKTGIMISLAETKNYKQKAKIIFHEIAGLVNDKGEMEKFLAVNEQQKRKEFRETPP